MSKEFNVTGVCLPALHYMVDIKEQLSEIKVLIDKGKYFTINKARQYGKRQLCGHCGIIYTRITL